MSFVFCLKLFVPFKKTQELKDLRCDVGVGEDTGGRFEKLLINNHTHKNIGHPVSFF